MVIHSMVMKVRLKNMNNFSLKIISWIFFFLNCLYIPIFVFVQLAGLLSSPYMSCVRILQRGPYYDSLMNYVVLFFLFIILNLIFLFPIFVFKKKIALFIVKDNKKILILSTIISHLILCYRIYVGANMDFNKVCGHFF